MRSTIWVAVSEINMTPYFFFVGFLKGITCLVTCLVGVLCVVDEDVTPQNILNFPQLYQYLQRVRLTAVLILGVAYVRNVF